VCAGDGAAHTAVPHLTPRKGEFVSQALAPAAPGGPALPRVKTLQIYLVKPSKYDDSGYLIQYRQGIIPSNALACLLGLTEDVRRRGLLAPTDVRVRVYDESVERVPVASICRRAAQQDDTRTVVCLVGVYSCLFDRATDLARRFRAAEVDVMIGGLHVGGVMALADKTPPAIQGLLDMGVTVVLGEVEGRWAAILRDAAGGRLQPVYDPPAEHPCLERAPLPSISKQHLKRFTHWNTATVDTSRGCPFNCSFCTIIHVQGRTIRARSAESITDVMRQHFRKTGTCRYYFTDDNFARNPNAFAILDQLARLRSQERIPVEVMLQADAAAYRIPLLLEKMRAAGVFSVFIGLESLNPANLKAAGKTQNQSRLFADMIAAYRRAGIQTHASYMIGFPHDTAESVRQEVRRLRDEVRPDMATFFMFTQLPGCRDHREMEQRGQWMDPDLNRYDCDHATMEHPHLSGPQWEALQREAYETFYSFDHMKWSLQQAQPRLYWTLLKSYFWYKWATLGERQHPMFTGVWRLKHRLQRRPGLAVDGRWKHMMGRVKEMWHGLRVFGRLFLEMEDLWLQTRPWTPVEYRLVEAGRRFRREAANWLSLDALAQEFRTSRREARRRWAWFMSRWPLLSADGIHSRGNWAGPGDRTGAWSAIGRWLGATPLGKLVRLTREVRLGLSFVSAMVAQA